jgi:ABC-type branched-subunit amino acid transport system substrate-binding protein
MHIPKLLKIVKNTSLACFGVYISLSSHLAYAERGVSDTTITIGASVVLTGPLGPQTIEYGQGSNLYFDSVNAKGGVNGRKIIYKTIDDGFDPAKALANTQKLIQEENVFLIFQNTGTAQTAAILPLITETKTVVFGSITGASLFRDKFNPFIFNVRASYASEAKATIKQFIQIGVKKVAVFYQDDGLGNSISNEMKKAAKELNFELVDFVKLDPKNPDFKTAAAQIEKIAPQALVLASAGKTFTDTINAVYETSARPSFYGFSVVNHTSVAKLLGPKARGIVLCQVMPSMRDTAVPLVAEFLNAVKQKDPVASGTDSQFEGFLNAKLLTEGLRKAGRNLTTESLIKSLETAGETRYGKFSARYTSTAHIGSTYVELAILDADGQLRR